MKKKFKKFVHWLGIYTKSELISFGTYLLSDKRYRKIEDNTENTTQFDLRYKQVHDADLDQWSNL